MAAVAAFLLRVVVISLAAVLFAGATLTLAAERVSTPRPTLVPVAPKPTTLTVPDVSGQAYVFAKGILQDNGFAWHVGGAVQGYAANVVSEQKPSAGTVVIDTGAPTVALSLSRNPSYLERGTPENDAPYKGTPIQLAPNQPPKPKITPKLEPVPIPQAPLARPSEPVQAPVEPAAPPEPAPQAEPTPQAVPVQPVSPPPAPATPTPVATVPTQPAPPAPATRSAQPRPPDFVVPGAPKEPRQGQSLPDRARALAAWIELHRQPTAANLNHWLYEHAYIVAGAKFGWWQGAEALQILIAVDRRAEILWGVGNQSQQTARKALAEVLARRR